jgi:hypothetical protein
MLGRRPVRRRRTMHRPGFPGRAPERILPAVRLYNMQMKRLALVLAGAAVLLSGCAKSSLTTTAPVTSTVTAAGVWSGCLAASCSLSMTLTDSAVTDSTGIVRGAGNWISAVSIIGTRTGSSVTLHAAQTGQTLAWEFTGIVSGSSLAGNMTGPTLSSATQTTFTRSP